MRCCLCLVMSSVSVFLLAHCIMCVADCPAALLRVLVAADVNVAGLSCCRDTCRTHLRELSMSTSTKAKDSTGQLQDSCPAADLEGQDDAQASCRTVPDSRSPLQDTCVTAVLQQF